MEKTNIESFSPRELRGAQTKGEVDKFVKKTMLISFIVGIVLIIGFSIAYSRDNARLSLTLINLCFWGFFTLYYYLTLKKNDGKIL